MTTTEPLIFDPEEGRYVLGGEPLHAGDVIEVELVGGRFAPARFEWSHGPEGQRRGCFVLGLAAGHDAFIDLPDGAPARWPARSAA